MPVINTNIPALAAQFNLGQTGDAILKSVQRLSSGLRINSAADDAAGMAISEELKSEVNGTNRAVQNAQDGISMIQTAEGALGTVHSILQRMRELAVEGANGDLNQTDRDAIQLEITQLSKAIDSISQNTRFNGLNLLTGSLASTFATGAIQVGTAEAASLSVSNVDLSGTAAGASYSLSICTTNGTATYAGSGVTQTISIRDMTTYDAQVLNFSRVGITFELQTTTSALSATQILEGLVSPSGTATSGNASDFTTASTGQGSAVIQVGPDNSLSGQFNINLVQIDSATLGLSSASVSTTVASQNLITSLDTAINAVSTQRATLGAQQNALQNTITNLQIGSENLTASKSRIEDLDVAAETVNLSKEQILQQAGTAVLAQANSIPQSVLKLLQ